MSHVPNENDDGISGFFHAFNIIHVPNPCSCDVSRVGPCCCTGYDRINGAIVAQHCA